MKIEDVQTNKSEYTENELDGMILVLEKAEEIKADSTLFEILKGRMKKRVKSIKSLADLKSKANEKMLEDDKIKS
jgi:hypothetical protein